MKDNINSINEELKGDCKHCFGFCYVALYFSKSEGFPLMGANLKKIDLIGEDLSGALLIASDLRGVDLSSADLIGADLRGADIRGANLRDSIFITQHQINSAKGSYDTQLPSSLVRPIYWER